MPMRAPPKIATNEIKPVTILAMEKAKSDSSAKNIKNGNERDIGPWAYSKSQRCTTLKRESSDAQIKDGTQTPTETVQALHVRLGACDRAPRTSTGLRVDTPAPQSQLRSKRELTGRVRKTIVNL